MRGSLPLSRYVFLFAMVCLCLALVMVPEAREVTLDIDQITFDRITVEDGLSYFMVSKIFEDSRGFMWFGTENGLNRYDGYNLKHFFYEPLDNNSLSDNYVRGLEEDENGNFWIATDKGLTKFDPITETFTRYLHDPENPQSLPANQTTSLVQCNNGDLLIGTLGGGLARFNEEDGTFLSYQHEDGNPLSISNNHVNALSKDRDGNIWVGMVESGGVNRFNPRTGEFKRYESIRETTDDQTPPDVLDVCPTSDGKVWFGTWENGMFELDPKSGEYEHHLPDEENENSLGSNIVNAIFEDEENDLLWIGTWGDGINLWDRDMGVIHRIQPKVGVEHSLSSEVVTEIYRDNQDTLWIGTIDNGVSRYDPNRLRFKHFYNILDTENSINEDRVYALLCDQNGIIWIGTDGGGLNRYDPETGNFKHYMNDPDDPHSIKRDTIISLMEADDGAIWVGNWRGYVYRFDPETEKFEHFEEDLEDPHGLKGWYFRSLCQVQDGTIWMGMEQYGINVYDPETGKFSHYEPDENDPHSISDHFVRCILEDSQGDIWVATNSGGLNRYDPEIDGFKHYQWEEDNPESLLSNEVLTLFEDQEKRLWVGSDQGLSLFHPETDQFTHYTIKDGLPNNIIKGILQDEEGCLWISTDKGLSRFNPDTEEFRNFDNHDGLQGLSFNINTCCKGKDGELYFGGHKGYNRIRLKDIKENPNIPPIHVIDLEVNGTSYPFKQFLEEKGKLVLSYRHNFLGFEFAALDYTSPEQNQYAFRMGGLEETWHYSGTRRYAQYTNLAPGNYVFQVIGSNNDGKWNREGFSIPIEITPPFWNTTLFRMIVAWMVIGLLAYIHHLRVQSVNAHRKKLAEEVERQTQQMRHQSIELEKANQELKKLSFLDSLTGIPNRRSFEEHYEKEWRRMMREKQPLSVLMIDIDYFKHFNDDLGHQAGDHCLQRVANTLRAIVHRPGDLVARYGGEEFVVVLSNTKNESAIKIAERMRRAVSGLEIPFLCEGNQRMVTVSVGVATDVPSQDLERQQIIEAADKALYHAKKQGRNQTCSYDSLKTVATDG